MNKKMAQKNLIIDVNKVWILASIHLLRYPAHKYIYQTNNLVKRYLEV